MGFGLRDVERAYSELARQGNRRPNVAHVLSLWERGEPRFGSPVGRSRL